MIVAIFQPPGGRFSILSCAPGVDVAAEAKRVISNGVPYWLVDSAETDALYAEQGEWREAWELSEDTIGRGPDGVGEA